ncbi:MAG: hypothetical protein FJX34_01640, partial [Alphaproteobacteria bacterium]|nr:hypothetical protein [Alphaproteobacteria bacterium]
MAPSNDCGSNNRREITNKAWREFIYGGMEYVDSGGGACKNPSTWEKGGGANGRRQQILGYDDDNQRYYMTGPGGTPAYACHRFLARARDNQGRYTAAQDQEAMQQAYNCCKDRSQKSICIENKAGTTDVGGLTTSEGPLQSSFCSIGTRCTVGDVSFEVYESLRASNYVCAKTYSVCPYNHLLGGGTETEKYDENDTTKLVNYCQHLNHCQKLPLPSYFFTSNLTGGYIDSSCRDLRGDSQNVYGYTAQLLPINTKGFSSPIIQCIKETMQNVFLNKAGHAACSDPNDVPNQNGVCANGNSLTKGQKLVGDSFFVKIQKQFQTLIKIVLTLSITFFGVVILLAVPGMHIERKTIFPYILKLALVSYFALGTAWQDWAVQGVLNASGVLASITFKPDDPNADVSKLDGCQFPRYNYADLADTNKANFAYPPGKEYLRIWDVLDCKIAFALGFGPDVSVPNLIFMALGGFLTGGYGLLFVVASFLFAFYMIFLMVKALQFFLVAITAIVILLYLSVFIIPLSLFTKTKSVFDGWWKQILGLTLQPMILFAYLGVLIAIFDNIVIGSATFDGDGQSAPKRINCTGAAETDSIYCIFNVADIRRLPGLEVLGIGLPVLGSMSIEKLQTIIKAALVMFIFSSFLDKMTKLATELVGGASAAAGNWAGNFKPSALAKQAHEALSGAQNRIKRAMKKAGGTVARGAVDLAQAVGNRGKSTSEPAGGSDDTGSSSVAPTDDTSGGKKGDSTSQGDAINDSSGGKKKGGGGEGGGTGGGTAPTGGDA